MMNTVVRRIGRSDEGEMAKQGLIPFFIPHIGCPQQCVFCNQHRIASGQVQATAEDVARTIEACTEGERHHTQSFWEVAFYGGSFTALPAERQERLLTPAWQALQRGAIQAIRCSTRPDAIDKAVIARLRRFGVTTVELGVQTMNQAMLDASKRGHTTEDVIRAVALLNEAGVTVGIQLLPGLPGESWHTLVATAVAVAALAPDFIRIYPVVVVEDTELADMMRRGEYTPLTTEEAIAYSAFLHSYMKSKGIPTIRIGLQATEDFDKGIGLVGGPYEPAMGEMVVNYEYLMRMKAVLQSHQAQWGQPDTVVVVYPRALTSKVRGLHNSNREQMESLYDTVRWSWCEWGSRSWQRLIPIHRRWGTTEARTVQMYIDGMAYVV